MTAGFSDENGTAVGFAMVGISVIAGCGEGVCVGRSGDGGVWVGCGAASAGAANAPTAAVEISGCGAGLGVGVGTGLQARTISPKKVIRSQAVQL